MKATVKYIYNSISSLNPTVNTISSLGNYVSNLEQQIADNTAAELMNILPQSSLAYKIVKDYMRPLSEKQMWVIAYELMKIESYVISVENEITKAKHKENQKKEASKAKSANKKSAYQPRWT